MGAPGAAESSGDGGLTHFEDTEGNSYDVPSSYVPRFKEIIKNQGVQIVGEPEVGLFSGLEESAPPEADQSDPFSPERMDQATEAWFGPMEKDPDAGTGAYDLPPLGSDVEDLDAGVSQGGEPQNDVSTVPPAPIVPPVAGDRAAREKAWAEGTEDLDRDTQTVGRGVHSPLKVPRYTKAESSGRGYLDQAGWGTGDEGAGIGGMADESARRGYDSGHSSGTGFVDSLLRYFGADIPMRVDRQAKENEGALLKDPAGNVVRDQKGDAMRAPPKDTVETSMEYGESGEWGEGAINNPKSLERAAKANRGAPVATLGREPVPRAAGRDVNAPEEESNTLLDSLLNYSSAGRAQGRPGETYKKAFGDTSGAYLDDEKTAQKDNPLSYGGAGFMAGVPQSFFLRLLGAPARVKEAIQAAERAGPGWAKFGERVAAGAVDALKNPGNIASSVLSGFGHSEGDTVGERLGNAAKGAAMEHVVGAALAAPAEAVLKVPREYGRETHSKFTNDLHSPEVAPTLVTAENAGTGLEAFSKRTGAPGYALTSEKGVRPSAELHAAQQAALRPPKTEAPGTHPVLQSDEPGHELGLALSSVDDAPAMERRRISGEPGQELRARAAESLTNAAENQRVKTVAWIRQQKKDYFASPEGQQEIPLSVVLDHFPDAPELRHRLLRKFRRPPYEPPRQFHESPVRRDAEGHRMAPIGRAAERRLQAPEPVPERMINAEELDTAIQFADTHGKSWTGKIEHADLPNSFKAYADYLREEVRNNAYKGLQAIDDNAHKYLGQWEANVSQIGIDPRTSPVRTELHNQHTLQVYNRLGDFKDQPLMREAVDDLAQFGADVKLVEQAEALAAQRKLVKDQHTGTGPGRYGLGKVHKKLNLIDPGLRAAGLENLGLNAQGAVRGGMAAPVNDYIYKLLGKQPNQSSEEDQQ